MKYTYLSLMSRPASVTRGIQMLPSGGGWYVTSYVPSPLSFTTGLRGSGPAKGGDPVTRWLSSPPDCWAADLRKAGDPAGDTQMGHHRIR